MMQISVGREAQDIMCSKRETHQPEDGVKVFKPRLYVVDAWGGEEPQPSQK